MISASHNPYYDNGIKVLDANGHKMDAKVEDLIEKYIDGEVDEIPFDFNRRRKSVVVAKENKKFLITKGAPEEVIKICNSYHENGKTKKLEEKILKKIRY